VKRKQKSGRGFTLVELIILVAILALFIFIAMPALKKIHHAGQSPPSPQRRETAAA
jgi:Tfp pilus assembly protein FimT